MEMKLLYQIYNFLRLLIDSSPKSMQIQFLIYAGSACISISLTSIEETYLNHIQTAGVL